MTDYNFGRLSKRQLTLRVWPSSAFESFGNDGFHFDWRRLFNPANWWRAIRSRYNWRFWWAHMPGGNHRCYCVTDRGRMLDVSLVLAGWGFVAFYSHFGGEVPCQCDEVMAEMFPDDFDE